MEETTLDTLMNVSLYYNCTDDLQDKAYDKPSEILQYGDRDNYANEYNRILLQSKREKIDYQYPIMKTRNSINIDSASNEQARSIQSYIERKRLKEERFTIPSQNKMSRNAIERNKTIGLLPFID